jgi:MYXO-CTERM domain-containing protein
MAPPATMQQNAYGDPQKAAPCGGAGTVTNIITPVQSGSTITLTIDETIYHPGHYRIAIAQNQAGLPPPPTVTGANCGSAAINANPTMPVVADGVFVHTAAFSAPQTTQIQLPSGFTCDNCVMQVVEFMANHPVPCFYYHCATVNITTNPVEPDAGMQPGVDASDMVPPGSEGGGCCDAGSSSPTGGLLGLAILGLILRRRRR